jgi:hypothetical protein
VGEIYAPQSDSLVPNDGCGEHGGCVCVKFCKGGHGWLESWGLAELNFLVLFEIVHIEIAVGCEPVLVGLDG